MKYWRMHLPLGQNSGTPKCSLLAHTLLSTKRRRKITNSAKPMGSSIRCLRTRDTPLNPPSTQADIFFLSTNFFYQQIFFTGHFFWPEFFFDHKCFLTGIFMGPQKKFVTGIFFCWPKINLSPQIKFEIFSKKNPYKINKSYFFLWVKTPCKVTTLGQPLLGEK